MRFNSIRTRTLLALILICVAIVFVIGGIWLQTSSQNIRNNIVSADLRDSELIGNYVKLYVDEVQASMNMAAGEDETVRAVRENNTTLAHDVFLNLVNATPQDDIAYVTDRNGRPMYCTCSTALEPSSDPPVIEANRSSPYATAIFYSGERGDYVFAIVSPIKDNGSIIGYAYDEIRPTDLYNFISKERKDLVHDIILIDQKGRAILYDNQSSVARQVDLSAYPPVKKVLGGEAGIIEHAGMNDSNTYVSAYYPIPGVGWGLVISTQSNLAYRPLQLHVIRIIGLCLLFIVALSVFGYFASRYLIGPVERLSGTMRKVAAGDYGVSIRAERDDEIGDLERAFNVLVSEIKKRDESITTEKERSEFYLDLMSHDINNMNHAGMGYLELAIGNLKDRIVDGDVKLIEKAYDALRSSSALIDNVRKIQRMRTGRLKPGIVNVCPMLAEVRNKYAEAPGRSVTVNYTPGGAGCYIMASDLFREAIANIVGNAIKHSDPAKPLVVDMALAAVEEGGRSYCRISIEDNGPGIPDEIKRNLFARFRGGGTDTRSRGLGLYIVKTLVEEYGGRVWVEDRVPGDHTQGARFVILMPATSGG